MTTLRFEGELPLSVPPRAVWALLTDVDRLVALTPAIRVAHTDPHGQGWLVAVALDAGVRQVTLAVAVQQHVLVAGEQLRVIARTASAHLDVTGSLDFALTTTQPTCLQFRVSADLPHEIAPIAHPLISRTLQGFFRNLRTALERE